MTVSRHRRRMSTTRALVASLVGVGLALVLGVAGAVAIYNTKDGQVQGSNTPEVQFPDTPTGAIAVLDGNGSLASLAVFAVRPAPDENGDDGVGGTIVPIPVSADVSGGFGDERLPVDETVSLFGSETIGEEVPALLGVTIDRLSIVTNSELAATLAPLGEIAVTLPAAATGSDGSVLADAGSQTLDGEQMAAILASRDPSISAADEYVADVAVWQAVADAVAAGLATPLSLTAEAGSTTTGSTIGELVARLTSGSIAVRPLRFDPIVSVDLNPRGVDAVALDRVEVAVVFGHIAPSRVAAPFAGYSFGVVSSFRDDQLPSGMAGLDVAYTAVKALFGLEANVRYVNASPGDAPASTTIDVANDSLVAAAESLGDVFGSVEVRVANTRIVGIDMVITLGTGYVSTLDAGTTTTVPAGEAQDTTVEGTS